MNLTSLGWAMAFLFVTVYTDAEGWKVNGAQDIDFGSTPQNVSQEFKILFYNDIKTRKKNLLFEYNAKGNAQNIMHFTFI